MISRSSSRSIQLAALLFLGACGLGTARGGLEPNAPQGLESSLPTSPATLDVPALLESVDPDASIEIEQSSLSGTAVLEESTVPEPSSFGFMMILVVMSVLASKKFRLKAAPIERL